MFQCTTFKARYSSMNVNLDNPGPLVELIVAGLREQQGHSIYLTKPTGKGFA